MNIFEKINTVMKRIEYLTKDDNVEFGTTKYKAISEEKVTSVIRKVLTEVGIVIVPISQESTVVELIRTEKSVNQRADVHTRYRIQNIDDVNDFIEVESNGSGVDTQDKAVGKAMTYAYKYMLLRTFAIPTGEDPDKISSAEIDDKIEKEVDKQKKEKDEEYISSKMVESISEAIRNKIAKDEYTETYVAGTFKKYNITKVSEIKSKDLADIKKELKI